MTAAALDMMRDVDLSSPDIVSAEMTRGGREVRRPVVGDRILIVQNFCQGLARPSAREAPGGAMPYHYRFASKAGAERNYLGVCSTTP